jgi:hypothetical protein
LTNVCPSKGVCDLLDSVWPHLILTFFSIKEEVGPNSVLWKPLIWKAA